MNVLLVVGVWLLTSLDGALMGYRLSMGRNLLVAKGAYHRRAAAHGVLLVQPALAVVVGLSAVLAARGGDDVVAAYDTAMARFVVVGGIYAAVIIGAWSLFLLRSLEARAAANVVVFGPLTLLRPAVVLLTVGVALWGNVSAPLLVTATLIVVPGVLVEPIADHRIATRALR